MPQRRIRLMQPLTPQEIQRPGYPIAPIIPLVIRLSILQQFQTKQTQPMARIQHRMGLRTQLILIQRTLQEVRATSQVMSQVTRLPTLQRILLRQ